MSPPGHCCAARRTRSGFRGAAASPPWRSMRRAGCTRSIGALARSPACCTSCRPRPITTTSCRSPSASALGRPRRSSCPKAMPLVATPAVVLQAYRYSESSKVVRLATRDLGVQSAIAKGALRPKSRFGAGLELLSEGTAQLYFRETRELHTLGAFDLVNLRRDLAADVGPFAGAAALAEVML